MKYEINVGIINKRFYYKIYSGSDDKCFYAPEWFVNEMNKEFNYNLSINNILQSVTDVITDGLISGHIKNTRYSPEYIIFFKDCSLYGIDEKNFEFSKLIKIKDINS